MAGPPALAPVLAFVGAGPQEPCHLGLQDILPGFFHQGFLKSLSSAIKALRSMVLAPCFFVVMVWPLLQDTGLIFTISLIP
jgi:hypothetical protein